MFSYKTYEMTQNAIIDEIQKYATQIFTLETQNNLEQNQHMSFSLSQSHSQESIPNDEEQHQYPDESQFSQMNIGRHIFNEGMVKSNILSNYNRSQTNQIQPINFKLMKHKHHNKNIHTQRSNISKRKKNRYAQNYVSPYNKREVNSTARSYMSKSFINPSKQSNNMKYIKKKINQQIQPQISYRKHEENINKQKNQKLMNIASKYKETKTLMQGYVDYMNEHIYKKERNEMNYLMELQKKGSNRTKEDLQKAWDIFLQKEREFKQSKKQRIREKQVQIMEQQQQYIKIHRQKTQQMRQKKERVGLTVEQNIRKIKRQKQKMKERLHTGQISNFITKSFQNKKFQTNNRDKEKDFFKSVLGISIEQNYSTIQEDSSQNINEMSQLQNKIRNTILKQQAALFYQGQSYMKKQKNTNQTAINKIMNKKANELSAEKKKITLKQGKSRSKSRSKNSKNISQLLNPKYFKSINQLQEYSTTKSKQKKSFQQREKFLNYRNKLQKRNQRLYGFDPKIMQASIQHFRRHEEMFQQNEQIANQRKYDPSSYRNISNLYPQAYKNQNNVRNLSTQSKIRHFQQRFKSYKNCIESSKVNEKSSNNNNPLLFKKPGSFSYKQVNSPLNNNNSSLIKIKATDMNFLFDSSNLSS